MSFQPYSLRQGIPKISKCPNVHHVEFLNALKLDFTYDWDIMSYLLPRYIIMVLFSYSTLTGLSFSTKLSMMVYFRALPVHLR